MAMMRAIAALFLLLVSSCSMRYEVEFLSDACLIPLPDYNYKLCKPLITQINKSILVIPKDFKTDLASIPRVLWSIYPPMQYQTIRPAILHDYLYRCSSHFTRYQIDNIFYYALLNQDLKTLTAKKYYYVVRLAGWYFYNETECKEKT